MIQKFKDRKSVHFASLNDKIYDQDFLKWCKNIGTLVKLLAIFLSKIRMKRFPKGKCGKILNECMFGVHC